MRFLHFAKKKSEWFDDLNHGKTTKLHAAQSKSEQNHTIIVHTQVPRYIGGFRSAFESLPWRKRRIIWTSNPVGL